VVAWQAEAADVQAGWEAYGRTMPQQNSLGQTVCLSGFSAYVKGWMGFLSSTGMAPTTPFGAPSIVPTWTLQEVTYSWSGSDLVWDAVVEKVSDRALLFDWGSGPGTTGQSFGPGRGNYWVRVFRSATASLPLTWPSGMASGEVRWWRVREWRQIDGWIHEQAFSLRLQRP